MSHCGRGRRAFHEERSDQQHHTWRRGEGRRYGGGPLQLMTVRPLADVSEGRSSGMMQKVTRLEEAKGRTRRFVIEMVTEDRSFEKSCEVRGEKENVIVGGGSLEGFFFDGLKTEETHACLNDNGKKCYFKGHVSKPMQRNWSWQGN